MERILIIEPNWLGDVLFTTPSIKALREKGGDFYICVLTHKRCLSILQNNPNINEIIVFESGRGIKGFFERIKLIPQLKSKNFDTVFFFSRSMSHAAMCALAGIKERVGYYTFKRVPFLTQSIKPRSKRLHRVEYFLDLLRCVGIDSNNKDYEFFINNEEKAQAEKILTGNNIKPNEPYFVINPGGNWLPKRWEKREFAKLCDELYKRYNTRIIITGAQKDIKLGEAIKDMCAVSKPVDICGKTTLAQAAAVLKNAKAVISNDSGPMHIAVSQKAPTVALFGPTDPQITGPYGNSKYVVVWKETECLVPCYVPNCKRNKCMDLITVADVMEAIGTLVGCSQN